MLSLSQMTNVRLFQTLRNYSNFKFDENGGKFSEKVENTVGKGNCSLRASSPFPTEFSKDL